MAWTKRYLKQPLGLRERVRASLLLTCIITSSIFDTCICTHPTGVDHSKADKYGNSPLHYAALGGQRTLVTVLLRHGADVRALHSSPLFSHTIAIIVLFK